MTTQQIIWGQINPSPASGPLLVEADTFIDWVVSGLLLPTTSGNLTGTLSTGIAYVVGQRLTIVATANTYPASQDTYVDLSYLGVLSYSSVANGAGAPALAANSIRLGFVVTGASAITSATTTGKDSLGNWMRNTVYSPSCVVKNSAAQSIPAAALTAMTWNTEVLDNNAMHSTSSNTSRITIATAGLYAFSGYMIFDDSGGGVVINRYFAQIIKNGTGAVIGGSGAGDSAAQPAWFPTCSVAGEDLAIAGDYYEIQVYQNSTGAVAVNTYATGTTLPRFSATRVG